MEQKLNHWEKRLVALVIKYGSLIEERRDNETAYFVEGFGQVGGKSPRSLIERKILKPADDGLFGGDSQTYTVA